jgi:hypothetical protein
VHGASELSTFGIFVERLGRTPLRSIGSVAAVMAAWFIETVNDHGAVQRGARTLSFLRMTPVRTKIRR